MDAIAVGFWGAFFGAAVLMIAASLVVYLRSHQVVALTSALSAAVSAAFVFAYLGNFPIDDPAVEARLLALVAVVTTVALGSMLMTMLGLLRHTATSRRVRTGLVALGIVVLAIGWLLEPQESLALGSAMAVCVGFGALALAGGGARRGDRLAWAEVLCVIFMLVAIVGLSRIALHRDAEWTVHAVSATSAVAYLVAMATALWTRHAYLIELRDVTTWGASYDPVTRMRSHAETSQMIGALFLRDEGESRDAGVIVVSIGNLDSLERQHGRAAMNHALFICAGRLRRCVPVDVEMGRLSDDGFLLLMRDLREPQRLYQVARQVQARLTRPVVLSTSRMFGGAESGQAQWIADAGVGVLLVPCSEVQAAVAVAKAQDMSRTAWTYPGRIAWLAPGSVQASELPAATAA